MKVWIYVEADVTDDYDVDVEEVYSFSDHDKARRWCEVTGRRPGNLIYSSVDQHWEPQMKQSWKWVVKLYYGTVPYKEVFRMDTNWGIHPDGAVTELGTLEPPPNDIMWEVYCWAETEQEAIEKAEELVRKR